MAFRPLHLLSRRLFTTTPLNTKLKSATTTTTTTTTTASFASQTQTQTQPLRFRPRLHLRPPQVSVRGMATSTAAAAATESGKEGQELRDVKKDEVEKKMEWLVIAPDHEGALERRLSVRGQHLEVLKPDIESGWCVMGGAYLSRPPQEGETPQMMGSVMIAVAASRDEVISRLKRDVYVTGGVWDWDKVQIHPFKSAVRKGM